MPFEFDLEFCNPDNTLKVMLSRSVNVLTLFLDRLIWFSKRLTSTCAHTFARN